MGAAVARLPVLALVGRPNVGKSTLFNRFTRSRAALVADVPGLTRDRQYGRGRFDDRPFIVIDSGGFEPVAKEGIAAQMARQTRQAVIEADVVVFLVDGRQGLSPRDREIAAELRRTAQRVVLAVNKTEGMPREQACAEFHALGLGEPFAVSSAHGDGVRELLEAALGPLVVTAGAGAATAGEGGIEGSGEGRGESEGEGGEGSEGEATVAPAAGRGRRHAGVDARGGAPRRVRVAVVGRPNTGKSTLVNALLGEERLIAFDQPGTTRDAVAIDFERAGRGYTLVDTAGLRRRGKVVEAIEKFSVIKTLQAIEDCNVCVLLLDAVEGVSDQDATIAGYILEAGRAVVVAVNKWDAADESARTRVKSELERKLHFLHFARVLYISALEGSGLGALMRTVDEACAAAMSKLPTPKLTRALQEAVERQAPPRRGPIRPKLRYAHQGGQNPPIVVIHGSALERVPEGYKRYLEGWFRERFALQGTPLRVEFRSAANPYAERG